MHFKARYMETSNFYLITALPGEGLSKTLACFIGLILAGLKFLIMKKLLFFCLLVFLFSCEKLENCKTCTTTISGGGMSSSTTFEACGSDLRKIDGQVTTSTASYGGISVTVTTRTTCK